MESSAFKSLARRAVRWLRVAVAFGLVGVLAYYAGVGSLAGSGAFVWPWVALGAIMVPFAVAIRAYNHTLLLNRHAQVVNAWEAFRLALIGAGLGLLLPQGAADMAKAHYGWRAHGFAEDMIVSSVLDKLTSLTAVAVMGTIGALAGGRSDLALVAAVLTLLTLVPVVLPGIFPWKLFMRVLAPGADVQDAAMMRSARPPVLLLVWVYVVSCLGWLVTYTIMYCCVLAVKADVGFGLVLTIAPVSSIARFIPISAGGIGLGEFTMAALLTRSGVSQAAAAQSALLSMLLLVFLPGAAGLGLLALGRRSDKKADNDAEAAQAES
jgi:uncharacterized membrane protein YbhN (UPF0104 family)